MYISPSAQEIKGFPQYKIDPTGNVTNSWRGKKLKHYNINGIPAVLLKQDKQNKGKWFAVNDLLMNRVVPLSILTPPKIRGREHWNYGKHQSEEAKAKISITKIGIKHPKFCGYYIAPDGTKHASSTALGAYANINARTAYRRAKQGKKGYKFEPI